MSVEQFDFALHARSLIEGKAVRAAEHARIELRDDAVFVSVLGMHGEPSLLWGGAVGRKNDQKARNDMLASDPRSFAEHLTVWNMLGAGFKATFPKNPPEGWFPQVVVATTAAWRHLHAGAERLFTVDDADARHAAETILWLAERREHLGTQAVVVLSEMLQQHYATGDPENEDRLDTWMQWLGLDDKRRQFTYTNDDGIEATVLADGVDDTRTEPDFDSAPVLIAGVTTTAKKRSLHNVMSAARRATEDAKVHKAKNDAKLASQPLRKVIQARHERMIRLYARIKADFPTTLPGLDEIASEDGRSWSRWRTSRENGYYATRRDGVLAATVGLMSREDAAEAWEKLLIAEDAVAFQRAVHDGRGITGTVRSVEGRAVEVVTEQPIVRARPGTELVVRSTSEPVMVVDDLHTEGLTTVLRLDCPKPDGRPAQGSEVVLVGAPFDWGRAGRSRGSAVGRLKQPAWTHLPADKASAPPARGGTPPADLLAQVMGRRA